MKQKVIKVGSSAAVVIPKDSMKELGLKVGDEVNVDVDQKLGTVSIQMADPVLTDKELISWTRKFIRKYKPALKALADK